MKKCRKCRQNKTAASFRRHTRVCRACASKLSLLRRNPKQHAKSNKAWAKRNPDKIRNAELKRRYGISLKDYYQLLKQQNGMCAVCNAVDSGPSRKNPKKREPLFVDHNHSSGKVRGLLCRIHNTALGLLEKDLTVLSRLVRYLEESCSQNST